MSKYLILTTDVYAASGAGSQTGRFLILADGILAVIPNGLNTLNIIYANNMVIEITLSANVVAGDYSAINYLTKQVESLQNSNKATLIMPGEIPNCFTSSGHNIYFRSITYSNPCCSP